MMQDKNRHINKFKYVGTLISKFIKAAIILSLESFHIGMKCGGHMQYLEEPPYACLNQNNKK